MTSSQTGSEVSGKDLETAELYLERLDDNGNNVYRPIPADYMEKLTRGNRAPHK